MAEALGRARLPTGKRYSRSRVVLSAFLATPREGPAGRQKEHRHEPEFLALEDLTLGFQRVGRASKDIGFQRCCQFRWLEAISCKVVAGKSHKLLRQAGDSQSRDGEILFDT